MAVADALLQFGPGLGETVRWSSLTTCSLQSTGTSPSWKMTGTDLGGVTLTVEGSEIPDIADGEYWKKNQACYEAVITLELNGVTKIGARAFNNLRRLASITASSVTDIGDYAFEGTTVRNREDFGTLTRIGVGAFKDTALTGNLEFSGAVTIGDSAFEGSSITGLDISKMSGRVGANLVKNCKSLATFKAANMPDIPESFFEGCASLTSFSLGAEMQNIGKRAFFGCAKLRGNFVSAAVTKSIGESAFEGTGFTGCNLKVRAEGFTIGANAFKDCKNFKTAICGSMPNVPAGLFDGCSALDSLSIDTLLENIGARAFAGCSSLEMSFTSADVTKSVGEAAFEGSGATSVDLTKHADDFTLGASAFKDCKYLSGITWSPTLATMPNSIFEGSGLSSVEIPATVTKFGEACFRNCKSLTTVTYLGHAEAPSSVFDGCDALKDVTVPDDYQYDEFGGYRLKGLSLGAKIGIGVGVAAFVIIVIVVVVVVLFVTGKIGGGKRDAEAVDA